MRHVLRLTCAVMVALLCAAAAPAPVHAQKLDAQYHTGLRAYDAGDYATARRNWEQAATADHGFAAYRLGLMYGTGTGVEIDFARAAELMDIANARHVQDAASKFQQYFRMAYGREGENLFRLTAAIRRAESGSPMAQHYVATLFATGAGVERNFSAASRWYERAAAQGFARSQRALISIYLMGLGRDRDPVEAYKWYIIYKAHLKTKPDKDVDFLIDHVIDKMPPALARRAHQKAAEWLKTHPVP